MFNYQKLYKRWELELKIHFSTNVNSGRTDNAFKSGNLVHPFMYWESLEDKGAKYRLYIDDFPVKYGYIDLVTGDRYPANYNQAKKKLSTKEIFEYRLHLDSVWKTILQFWAKKILDEGQQLIDLANSIK